MRKGETAEDYQPLLAELNDKGAIAVSTQKPVLVTINSEQVKQLLLAGLQVGQQTANTLMAVNDIGSKI